MQHIVFVNDVFSFLLRREIVEGVFVKHDGLHRLI